MRARSGLILMLIAGLSVGLPAFGQSVSDQSANQSTTTDQKAAKKTKKGRSPGGDVGSGSGDIGKGAAKGAGSAAKGVGEGAADLATLHPINAATSVAKGAGTAGKDVTVGTTKGSAKIVKGIGRGIKHLF